MSIIIRSSHCPLFVQFMFNSLLWSPFMCLANAPRVKRSLRYYVQLVLCIRPNLPRIGFILGGGWWAAVGDNTQLNYSLLPMSIREDVQTHRDQKYVYCHTWKCLCRQSSSTANEVHTSSAIEEVMTTLYSGAQLLRQSNPDERLCIVLCNYWGSTFTSSLAGRPV
jgi:hypothetical protein